MKFLFIILWALAFILLFGAFIAGGTAVIISGYRAYPIHKNWKSFLIALPIIIIFTVPIFVIHWIYFR